MGNQPPGTGAVYQCPHCDSYFTNAADANRHRKECSGGSGSGNDPDPKYACGVCGKMFSSSLALGTHAGSCHADEADQH